MLHPAKRLAREGVAVHWLRHESKAPVESRWSSAPVNKPFDLEETYRAGYNVGIRLGRPSEVDKGLFLYVLDVDVKGDEADADEAHAALDKILPNWEKHPYVQSGRGGHSQHIYLVCEDDLPSKKLAHSSRKVTWTDIDGKEHHSWSWEIERFGTGKQVAAPPSIHPETKNEYTWGREINWDDLDAILVQAASLEPLDDEGREDRRERSSTRTTASSLADYQNKKTLGIDEDEAWEYLLDLDPAEWNDDRDGWLKVGMACHHEFNGTDAGYKLWRDYSKKSDKFDEDDLERVWESFGNDTKRRPVRFATIKAAGAATRELRERKGATDDDDDRILDEEDPETRAARLIPRTETGEIKVTAHTVQLLLETDVRTRGTLGLNTFSGEVCLTKSAGYREALSERKQKDMVQLNPILFTVNEQAEKEGLPLEDRHYHALRAMLEAARPSGGYGIKIPDRDLESAISNLADENTFHPIVEFLESLEWDGTERIDYLFVDYLGTPDDEYHRQTAGLWMTAGVTRVFQPGHKFDFVPIVEGKQGLRKSTFIQTLAVNPQWFVEMRGDIFDDPKKVVETLDGSWIAEIPELNSFTKSDLTAVKAFFSAGKEKVRESYGRKAKNFQRQSIYMGSTNDAEYLRDPTGNRRMWPIKTTVDQIDTDKLEANVLQLWAEAVHRYRKLAKQYKRGHLPLYLTGAARETAKTLQDSRMIETQTQGWAGDIAQWANTRVRQSALEHGAGLEKFRDHQGDDPLVLREFICAYQVWLEVLNGTKEAYGRGNSLKVVEAIRSTGEWTEHGLMRLPGYGPQKCFKRVEKAARITKRSKSDLLG